MDTHPVENSSTESINLARERTRLASERTRLSNERTFLAWLRTGLASVGGGIAIIRLLVFENPTHQVISQMTGGTLVLLGIAIFILSLIDYRISYKKLKITTGSFSVDFAATAIVTILVIVAISLLAITMRYF